VIVEKMAETVAPPLTSQIIACVVALAAIVASLWFGKPVELDDKLSDTAETIRKEVDKACKD
jgi:hypothetical protein